MSEPELIGVVRGEQPRRLTVEATQFRRWPRKPAPDRAPHDRALHHAQSPAVILLPMRAEVAAALAEARQLGKRFYLVTRD